MHTFYDFNNMYVATACDFPADGLGSLSELSVHGSEAAIALLFCLEAIHSNSRAVF